MILAEKISKLRKQNGWSQEDLAMRLGVSRQSVSKWESTASMPDLDKIIKLSELFGVSTDYLLKEEIEDVPDTLIVYDDTSEGKGTFAQEFCIAGEPQGRPVSLETANKYMDVVEQASKKIALGVMACILSPVLLILLGGMSEYQVIEITEDMAAGIGMTILMLIITGAVALFVLNGMKLEKFAYMEKEPLTLEYGVAGIVEMKKENFESTYKNCIATGVALCILSVIPIFIAAAFSASDMTFVYCCALLLVIISCAVYLFVRVGMVYGSYQKLLEEGEYTCEKKIENQKNSRLATVYWCIVIAVYLGYSFVTMKWYISWVIWPCAGVLFAAVCGVASMIRKRK